MILKFGLAIFGLTTLLQVGWTPGSPNGYLQQEYSRLGQKKCSCDNYKGLTKPEQRSYDDINKRLNDEAYARERAFRAAQKSQKPKEATPETHPSHANPPLVPRADPGRVDATGLHVPPNGKSVTEQHKARLRALDLDLSIDAVSQYRHQGYVIGRVDRNSEEIKMSLDEWLDNYERWLARGREQAKRNKEKLEEANRNNQTRQKNLAEKLLAAPPK
jgi:hypothetical protein